VTDDTGPAASALRHEDIQRAYKQRSAYSGYTESCERDKDMNVHAVNFVKILENMNV
jgi:hypothetical protein